MSVNTDDGVSHHTRADWDALRQQCARVLAECTDGCGQALRAQSEAVEHRLNSGANRFEREKRL